MVLATSPTMSGAARVGACTPARALRQRCRCRARHLPPSPRLHHPSSPPPSHSQPLLPFPATCSLIRPTPSPSPFPLLLHPPPFPTSPPQRLPCVLGCPSVPPDHGSPKRGVPRVPAGAGGAFITPRLNRLVLRIGLRWRRGYGDDPTGFV